MKTSTQFEREADTTIEQLEALVAPASAREVAQVASGIAVGILLVAAVC